MKWVLLVAVVGLILAAGRPPDVKPLVFDSAARAVGEVARALGGPGRGMRDPFPEAAGPFLFLLRQAPQSVRHAVLQWGMSQTLGLPARAMAGFDLDAFFAEFTRRYPDRKYPAIVLGSPGGGVAHLAALLDAPFLPVCALLGVRHRIHPDDMAAYLRTARVALEHVQPDDRFELIVHYDPIHDRDLVAHASLIRVRLLSLPEVYREFIRGRLAAGGTLVLAEGTYPWPQAALAPRVWLQVGGLGGISPEEFLALYPPPGPVISRPESEWGCPEEFAGDVRAFARAEGFPILDLPADHPTDYSVLAYRAHLAAGAREGVALFDCFTTVDARFSLRTGIPPVHLPFGTVDALAFARDFLAGHPVEKRFLLLHPTYAFPPDWASLVEWREVFGDRAMILVDEPYWPDDPYAPFAAAARVAQLEEEWSLPKPLRLSVQELVGVVGGRSSPSRGRTARGP